MLKFTKKLTPKHVGYLKSTLIEIAVTRNFSKNSKIDIVQQGFPNTMR